MAETHEEYGRRRAVQGSDVPQIEKERIRLSTTSSQPPDSNGPSRPFEPGLTLELPAWPTTALPSTGITKPWQSSLPPPEVNKFPIDEHLLAEALNTVRWSLIQLASRQDDASLSELPAEDFAYLKPAIIFNAINETNNSARKKCPVRDHDGATVCRSRSISRERGRQKIHGMRSSLKASIYDFASELEYCLELTKRAKAVLESKERERTRTVECTSCFVSSHESRDLASH